MTELSVEFHFNGDLVAAIKLKVGYKAEKLGRQKYSMVEKSCYIEPEPISCRKVFMKCAHYTNNSAYQWGRRWETQL